MPSISSTTRVSDIIGAAAKIAGKIGSGRTLNASEIADSLDNLNRMIDSWRTRSVNVYTIKIERFTLTPAQPSYTIGPGGDFVTDRPVRIERANIILAGSPEVRVPMQIIDDQQWAAIRVTQISTTLPLKLYCDGAFPESTIFLWPYPSAANDLELFSWQSLGVYATATDAFALPPGYEDAVVYSLAERLCALWRLPVTGDMAEQARRARTAIQALNTRANLQHTDVPETGKITPYFNYRTGGLR